MSTEEQGHAPGLFGWISLGLTTLLPVILALTLWASLVFHPEKALDPLYATTSQLIEIIVILLAFFAGFRPVAAIARLPRPVRLGLILLMILAFGGAGFIAVERPNALFDCVVWSIHVLFGLAIAALIDKSWRLTLTRLWVIFLIGLIVYSAMVVLFVALIKDEKAFDWLTLGIGVFNVRAIIFYLVPGFGAALGLVISASSSRRQLVAIFAASIMVAITCWSGSRSAVLSFVIVPVVALVLIPKIRTTKFVTAFLLSLTLGSALSFVHQSPDPAYNVFRRAATEEGEMSDGRFAIWSKVLGEVERRPLFGHGDQRMFVSMPGMRHIHPHNSVLQIGLQWGFVGVALFFGLIGWIWWHVLMNARRDPASYLPAFLAGNGLLFTSLLDGSLFWPHPIMVGAFSAALGMAQRRSSDAC
jgi:O-antigen ligase